MRKGLFTLVVMGLGLAACGKTDSGRCDDICAKDAQCGYIVDEVACRTVCKDSLSSGGSACSTSLASVDDCYSSATCATLPTCDTKYAQLFNDCGWGGYMTDPQRCDDICAKTYACDTSTDQTGCTNACIDSLTGATTTCLADLASLDNCYYTTACVDLSNLCLSTYNATASACGW